MTSSSSINDLTKNLKTPSICDIDDISTENELVCEESNPESNNKKRKLSLQKVHQSKKIRRSQSESHQETSLLSIHRIYKHNLSVKDTHCWLCHKPENIIICHFCPRAYHADCLISFFFQNQYHTNGWVCPECVTVMMSECSANINSVWMTITQLELNEMLSFVLLRLYNINGSSQFQTPVDSQSIRDYYDVIKHPIHLNLLKLNVCKSKYHSVNAFFSDFKWILHNCTIYNGVASILTNYAKNLEKLCVKELNLLKSCPECFKQRMPFMIKVLNEQNNCNLGKVNIFDKSWAFKYDESSVNEIWMTKLCKMIHPLVWVRLHGYPIWPGKLISFDEETALVLFFGDYDLNIVPIGSICVHTQSNHKRLIANIANFATRRPATDIAITNSFTKEYQLALEELNIHLDNIKKKIDHFSIPHKKIEFNIQKGIEYYERLRGKAVKEAGVVVASSIEESNHSRDDFVSDVALVDKFEEVKSDIEKLDSNSSISFTSNCRNSIVKQSKDSSIGSSFFQNFEHNVHNLVSQLKKECLTCFKHPSSQEDSLEEWKPFNSIMEPHLQNKHQQTDCTNVAHVSSQFSSHQFDKEDQLANYVKYLEQCLATSEIELRRQEIMSSIRHEEYLMEFTKQQKEMKTIFDKDVMDIVKIVRDQVEDKFVHTVKALKTNEWCAFCGKLARFYCCWNTCYCNQDCQTKHWELHKTACTQVVRPSPTVVRSSPTVVLNHSSFNGMQGLYSVNGDSVTLNGPNVVDFQHNIHLKQRLPLKR